MTDTELIEAFEHATLRPGDFHHEVHVKLAWLYSRERPLVDALARITDGLMRLTVRLGVPEKYHATITCAYVLLINERLERTGRAASWSDFAMANPDLLARNKAALLCYYSPEELASDLARRVFVLPSGKAGLPAQADQRNTVAR